MRQRRSGSRTRHLFELPRSGEGHCDFTPEQIGSAFAVLTEWVNTGKRPGP